MVESAKRLKSDTPWLECPERGTGMEPRVKVAKATKLAEITPSSPSRPGRSEGSPFATPNDHDFTRHAPPGQSANLRHSRHTLTSAHCARAPSGAMPRTDTRLEPAMNYDERDLAGDLDIFCHARMPCAAIVARLDDPNDPEDPGIQMVTHTTKELRQEQVLSLLMALKMGYQLVLQSVADQAGTNVHTLDERIEAMMTSARPRFESR